MLIFFFEEFGQGFFICRYIFSIGSKIVSIFLLDFFIQSYVFGYFLRVLELVSSLWYLNCWFIDVNGVVDIVESYICFV